MMLIIITMMATLIRWQPTPEPHNQEKKAGSFIPFIQIKRLQPKLVNASRFNHRKFTKTVFIFYTNSFLIVRMHLSIKINPNILQLLREKFRLSEDVLFFWKRIITYSQTLMVFWKSVFDGLKCLIVIQILLDYIKIWRNIQKIFL